MKTPHLARVVRECEGGIMDVGEVFGTGLEGGRSKVDWRRIVGCSRRARERDWGTGQRGPRVRYGLWVDAATHWGSILLGEIKGLVMCLRGVRLY